MHLFILFPSIITLFYFRFSVTMAPRKTRQYLCYLKQDNNDVSPLLLIQPLYPLFLDLFKLPYPLVC